MGCESNVTFTATHSRRPFFVGSRRPSLCCYVAALPSLMGPLPCHSRLMQRVNSSQRHVTDMQHLASLRHLRMPCSQYYDTSWCKLWLSETGTSSAGAAAARVLDEANRTAAQDKCTCAFVSTSGVLLSQRIGAQIDSHDLVIRAGLAPTVGYEPHVGSRTSVRYIHTQYLRTQLASRAAELLASEQNTTRFWLLDGGNRTEDLQLLQSLMPNLPWSDRHALWLAGDGSATLRRGRPRRGRQRWAGTASPLSLQLLQVAPLNLPKPRGLRRATYAGLRIPLRWEVRYLLGLDIAAGGAWDFGLSQLPSTGLLVLHHLLTRDVCASVRLFGFSAGAADEKAPPPYHYWPSEDDARLTTPPSGRAHYVDRAQAGERFTSPARQPLLDCAAAKPRVDPLTSGSCLIPSRAVRSLALSLTQRSEGRGSRSQGPSQRRWGTTSLASMM